MPSANAPARAGELVGRATVIDGGTLEIRGQRAAFALADRIGRWPVTCAPRDIDRYGRVVAVCAAGGEALNAFMVRRGWALTYWDYSTAYVDEEAAARPGGAPRRAALRGEERRHLENAGTLNPALR